MLDGQNPVPKSVLLPGLFVYLDGFSRLAPLMKMQIWSAVKKTLLWVFGIAFVLVVSSSVYIMANYNQQLEGSADCAVVFGAAVWRDNIPSDALHDRTMAAIDLYNNGQVQCLIFSGGPSKYGEHEAEVMKQLALAEGVPVDVIWIDDYGLSTWNTIQNLAWDFDNPDSELTADKSYVFVSNDFHLARIGLLARKHGIKNFYLHSSPYLHGRYPKELYFFIREIGGVLFYGLTPKSLINSLL